MRDALSIASDRTDPVAAFVFDNHAVRVSVSSLSTSFDNHARVSASSISTSGQTKEMMTSKSSNKLPSSKSMRCTASPISTPSLQKFDGFAPPMGSFAQKSSNRNVCPPSPTIKTNPNNPPLPPSPHSSSNNNNNNKVPSKLPLIPSGTKRSRGSKGSRSSADSALRLHQRSFVPPSGSFFGRFHNDHHTNDNNNTRNKNDMLNDIARASEKASRSPTEKKNHGGSTHNELDMDDLAAKYHCHLANVNKESSDDKSRRRHTTYESPAFVGCETILSTTRRGEVYVPPQAPSMQKHVPEPNHEEHRALPSMYEALAMNRSHDELSAGIISWDGDLADPGNMSAPSLRAEPSLGKPTRLYDSGKNGSLNHHLMDQQQHSSKRKEKKPSFSGHRRASAL
jgi:hypothetical protein